MKKEEMKIANKKHVYIAIDLKSFYASVECVERGLDPLTTNLVVADASKTEKTICLAVSPALKEYGIPGRARLFEVVSKVREMNAKRNMKIGGRKFQGESCDALELQKNKFLSINYIAAPPRMAYYMEYSTKIYQIYLKYIAPEDIHVYSIDEVFIDATEYLQVYGCTPRELAMKLICDVLESTGVTATAGIGDNLYICKIAMDIVAKHVAPDRDGVRIAQLDERSYREQLWDHRPLTDFWRVGNGYAKKLEEKGLMTMGDIARCSIGDPEEFYNEELLYRLFGINAELLIDHAWGYEPCTIRDVKAYKPSDNSISSGQVLSSPYSFKKARLIVREMTDLLALDLVEKHLVTNQIVLTLGYDVENINNPELRKKYKGEIVRDHYGRRIPKHAHGTQNMEKYNSSTKQLMDAVCTLYDRIADPKLLVRKITVTANHVMEENAILEKKNYHQISLFDYDIKEDEKEKEQGLQKEKKLQKAMLEIKKKYGKNAVLKGMNFEEGATTRERNGQIGGHKA